MAKQNISILHQHYTTTRDAIETTSMNPIALQMAIGWAQKCYGSGLTTITMETILSLLEEHPPATTPTPGPQSNTRNPSIKTLANNTTTKTIIHHKLNPEAALKCFSTWAQRFP